MSYFSNILTVTKTRYNSLRQNDDADGDTEDDSHITRALRNYYLETPERPYPGWLPPPTRHSSSPAIAPAASLRNTYGRKQPNPPQQGGAGTSLSDIWDAPQPDQGRPSFSRNPSATSTQTSRPQMQPGDDGSYSGPAPGAGGGMTAQQRIKERLWGSRGTSSPPPQQQYAPPKQHQQQHAPPTQRLEMPVGPSAPRRGNGGSSGGQPHMGSGMPWDDGTGTGYHQPEYVSGGSNMRRGGPGGRPADGRPPYR